MSSSCILILVGVVSLVSEILVLSKTAKFPFRTMDYSPWSSKNLIDWNRLKKFMQVGLDVTHICTNFGGHVFLVSEIPLLSKMAKFPFRTMDYSPWSSKNLIDRNRLKKLMQVEVDVKCMQANFGWHGFSGYGEFASFLDSFKMAKISLQTIRPWGSKNRICAKNSCK